MLALASLLVALVIVGTSVGVKLPRESRGVYVCALVVAVFVGIVSIISYTVDNEVLHGQVDMPGDAQYYFYGAMSYLEVGATQTYYPLYERYLAAFLRGGGPILARLGQLLTWLLAFSFTVWSLALQKVTVTGLKRVCFLMVGSGIYYGLVTVFNRDLLILAGLALIHALVVQSEGFVRRLPLMAVLVLAIAAVVACLDVLQPWQTPILVAALLMEYAVWTIAGFRTPQRSAYWKALATLIAVLGTLAILKFGQVATFVRDKEGLVARLFGDVVVQGGMVELGGASRDALSPFRLLFGPGLIRPLFASQYFQVWVPTHAAFYWWGTLVWYFTLLVGVPILLRKPAGFLGKRGTTFLLTLFVGYFIAYLSAYGSGIGLRKRAVLAYLFTSFLASGFWTQEAPMHSEIARWKTRVPRDAAILCLVVLLGIAQLLSI